MRPFRELEVWRLAHQLTLDVYARTSDFPRAELYGISSQLQRAASSVSANIVEGSVRGEREFARYLKIALGSAAETEYFLLLAKDLGYVQPNLHAEFERSAQLLQRKLVAFITAVEKQAES